MSKPPPSAQEALAILVAAVNQAAQRNFCCPDCRAPAWFISERGRKTFGAHHLAWCAISPALDLATFGVETNDEPGAVLTVRRHKPDCMLELDAGEPGAQSFIRCTCGADGR